MPASQPVAPRVPLSGSLAALAGLGIGDAGGLEGTLRGRPALDTPAHQQEGRHPKLAAWLSAFQAPVPSPLRALLAPRSCVGMWGGLERSGPGAALGMGWGTGRVGTRPGPRPPRPALAQAPGISHIAGAFSQDVSVISWHIQDPRRWAGLLTAARQFMLGVAHTGPWAS